MSKILFISNISNRITTFVTASIAAAHSLDLDFYQAANWNDAEPVQIDKDEKEYNIKIKNVPISRNPLSKANLIAYKELVDFIKKENIDYIHCNTPTGGILGRLAGKKCKVKKVIYQAHGFHFYKGAPIKNWMLYYPVEKICSRWTDVLITINQEDFSFAKTKMKSKIIEYVPGVGIDLERISNIDVDRAEKRCELGVPNGAILLLSVGELNKNKNHETVIRAIADTDVYYVIAGIGAMQDRLQQLILKLGISDRVKLLGFRDDVAELCKVSDVFVFPSLREGLPVSVMEAMACGKPCVASRIRGNTDLIDEDKGGILCSPDDTEGFRKAILKLASDRDLRQSMGEYNAEKVKSFGLEAVTASLRGIYEKIL